MKNLDFRPGEYGYPAYMAASDGRLFFTAETETPGLGLWTSDGSTAGTVLVKDFDSCDDSYYAKESRPSYLTAVGRPFVLRRRGRCPRRGAVGLGRHARRAPSLVKDIRSGTP